MATEQLRDENRTIELQDDRGAMLARMPVRRPSRTLPEAGRAGPGDCAARGAGGRPLCRWCQLEVLAPRRRTFCSAYCVHEWRLRSDPGYLRDQVFLRDKGVCALCATDTLEAYRALKRSRGKARAEALAMWGLASVSARRTLWDADHILPVAEGGGQCELGNLRTLCLPCHREVTADLRRRLRGRAARDGGDVAEKGHLDGTGCPEFGQGADG